MLRSMTQLRINYRNTAVLKRFLNTCQSVFYYDDKIQEKEVGRVCSMRTIGEKFFKRNEWKNLKGRFGCRGLKLLDCLRTHVLLKKDSSPRSKLTL
jgi:hypothetical protein